MKQNIFFLVFNIIHSKNKINFKEELNCNKNRATPVHKLLVCYNTYKIRVYSVREPFTVVDLQKWYTALECTQLVIVGFVPS